jgi:hypothetical protein
MRTPPRNWPRRMPRGDTVVRCYYCDDPVPRSLATLDYDGRLRCTLCRDHLGRTESQCAADNRAAYRALRRSA